MTETKAQPEDPNPFSVAASCRGIDSEDDPLNPGESVVVMLVPMICGGMMFFITLVVLGLPASTLISLLPPIAQFFLIFMVTLITGFSTWTVASKARQAVIRRLRNRRLDKKHNDSQTS